MKDDPNQIAKFEKAISKKYGKEAIENPKKFWNSDKEEKFLKQRKIFYGKVRSKNLTEMQERKKYKISSKFSTKEVKRECPVCEKYLLSNGQFAYLARYECCKQCYIVYVEGREARWSTGWRPKQ